MPLSAEQLLSIAQDYWRSDKEYYLRQEKSPEAERLEALWDQALESINQWHVFLDDLERELPGFTIGDSTSTSDACFRCVAYPTKGSPLPPFRWVVVGCVSILAPTYIVYGVDYDRIGKARRNPKISFEPLPPEMKLPADVIARKIEETFGASKLPREMAEIPVPLFVEWKEPPHTMLFHALFTNDPENVP